MTSESFVLIGQNMHTRVELNVESCYYVDLDAQGC